ncbi:MAG TPA: aspartate/glutamate racemase family protein [Streptosporangiaceae bacterium]|nr:aspartate/glutamate racemase family protein [Streptosporangiaceae bacterium]
MRFALINSGLGLLATASELHQLRPDADLVIAMDPDGMPWGPRDPEEIAERSMTAAQAAAAYEPDVIVMACNTGSVHALDVLRAAFEPGIPVVGTVPAIKPAAAAASSVAIWSTVATSESAYLRRLIEEFGSGADVTPVPCPGLATAVDAGDIPAIADAIAAAAERTPADCGAIVLGCTEYELAADQIGAAAPNAILFGSATAVAAQTLRRAAPSGHELSVPDGGSRLGTLTVLLSGQVGALPPAALIYRQGRELAQLDAGLDPSPGVAAL